MRTFLFLSFLLFSFSVSSFADNPISKVCDQKNCIAAEVVTSPADMERGLMFRKGLAADKGMLFLFDAPGKQDFWMKNMSFDLDILWISNDKHIAYIGDHIPACAKDPCAIYGPDVQARYVLEVTSGYTAAHQWKIGDLLTFEEK